MTALIIIGVILLILLVVFFSIRSAIMSFFHRATGMSAGSLRNLIDQAQAEDPPKSVSGGDSIFLPRILKDFPDFSLITAKEEVRKRIEQETASAEGLRIHAIAISDYRTAGVESEIVFQCSFEIVEGGVKKQKRYCLHYVFAAEGKNAYAGMTCPNCGAPIRSTSAKRCEYCDCRLVNVTAASWKFTRIYEK